MFWQWIALRGSISEISAISQRLNLRTTIRSENLDEARKIFLRAGEEVDSKHVWDLAGARDAKSLHHGALSSSMDPV